MKSSHSLGNSIPLKEHNDNAMNIAKNNAGPAKTDKRPPLNHGIMSNPTMGGGINRSVKPMRGQSK